MAKRRSKPAGPNASVTEVSKLSVNSAYASGNRRSASGVSCHCLAGHPQGTGDLAIRDELLFVQRVQMVPNGHGGDVQTFRQRLRLQRIFLLEEVHQGTACADGRS
jgi:hypothetical protein